MRFLPRPLERVRTVLFGPRTPGRHRRGHVPAVVPRIVHDQPTPEVWGARVVAARAGRAAAPVPSAVEVTGALVRPYVFTPEEWRQVRLSARQDAWQVTR